MPEATREKLLLLSANPPGSGSVGEIILRDMLVHYGTDAVHCVAVVGPRARFSADERLDVETITNVYAGAARHRDGALSALGAFARTLFGMRREVERLADRIARVNRGCERVFAVLNSGLMMALAHRVARRLGKPLVTLVWDPPGYLLTQSRFDRMSRTLLLREFEKSVAASERVAVVSETMGDTLKQSTRASIVLLRHGLLLPGAISARSGVADEWVVGFAGSMYAEDAWRAFVSALDGAGWRVAGRRVRIRVLSSQMLARSQSSACIEFLGHRPLDEAQSILAATDVTYMPQPFAPQLRDLCRYAFPTKLANYLAVGRPVFVHCPADSELAEFVATHRVGASCHALDAGAIIAALERLLADPVAYRSASETAFRTAQSHFGLSSFHAAVDRFLARSSESDRASVQGDAAPLAS